MLIHVHVHVCTQHILWTVNTNIAVTGNSVVKLTRKMSKHLRMAKAAWLAGWLAYCLASALDTIVYSI
jgi:ABC-type Co2+ transport system permease subunit